jgi:hypothetical protein
MDQAFNRTFTTDAGGRYEFTLVPASRYVLKVERSGFAAYVQTGISLRPGDSQTQDIHLQVGAVTQQVSVTADVSALRTSDADVSSELNTTQIDNLPIGDHMVWDLVFTNSSVQNSREMQNLGGVFQGGSSTNESDFGFFNFGGGFHGTTAFLIDGTWSTGADWGNPQEYPMPTEDAAEMKVQQHGFSVQYGWSTGNTIALTTKSGTNVYHGEGWEFLQNTVLDAASFFQNAAGEKKAHST